VWDKVNILVALGTMSKLSLSALDRGDAIASDDSTAAVKMERNRILFYQATGA